MTKKILIALGGNALLQKGEEGTFDHQVFHARQTCKQIYKLLEEGYEIALTHGNGPQVGNILLQNELTKEKLPAMPLDVCGSESQGLIGYMIQKEFHHVTKGKYPAATIVTQVAVHPDDPAFKNPTKPIGLFYSEEEAEKLKTMKRWDMVYQEKKGYRRIVASPVPIDIVEKDIIQHLFQQKVMVIACGGGGIPVIKEKDHSLKGVEAVIDKDLTGALLAHLLNVDIFVILTDVEKVCLDFGKATQKDLDKITLSQAQKYIEENQFGKGSMEPKVRAALTFIEKGGKQSIITSLDNCLAALEGKTGTHFSH